MPVVRTTGEVGTGDFIACCQLIKSVGDSVGGLLYKTDYINGKAITKLYYGVTVQRCPDDISEGNAVATYPIQLLYAGWIEAQSNSAADNKKKIWAVGNSKGLEAYFSPYKLQNADGTGGTGENALDAVSESLMPNAPSDNTLKDDTSSTDQTNTDDELTKAITATGAYSKIIGSGTIISPTASGS